ncbi:MAG: aldehyde dehydrogenase family protein, partial [Nocardioidaceae bacterium]
MTTRTLQNLINGEFVASADGRTSGIVNPATEEEFAEAAVSGAEDVDRAMKAASKAFETWRDATPADRQKALLKLADAMEARADEFVRVESENTGKPLGLTASEELPPAIDQVRFFAGAARVLEGR